MKKKCSSIHLNLVLGTKLHFSAIWIFFFFFFSQGIIMILVLICDFQKYHYNVYETKSANLNSQMRNSGTLYLHQFYDNWCITNAHLSCIIYKAMFNLKAFLTLKSVYLCIFRSHLFRASQLLTFNDSHYGEQKYWNQGI